VSIAKSGRVKEAKDPLATFCILIGELDFLDVGCLGFEVVTDFEIGVTGDEVEELVEHNRVQRMG
jgi:hypothetical protein